MNPRVICPPVAGAVLLLSNAALAQAQNIPIGGRTAVMAAAIAEGHDHAMPLVNPAGVAGVSSSTFGLSASLYSWSSQKADDPLSPGGYASFWGNVADNKLEYSSSGIRALPTSVAYFQHIKLDSSQRLVLSVAALVPVSLNVPSTMREKASFPSVNGYGDLNLSLTEQLQDLYAGPTVAYGWKDWLRLGVSIMGVQRTRYRQSSMKGELSASGGNTFSRFDSSMSTLSKTTGVLAMVGAQIRVIDQLWAGVTAKSPTLTIEGTEDSLSNDVGYVTTPTGATLVFDSKERKGSYAYKPPPSIGAGLAYVEPKSFGIAADGSLRFKGSSMEKAKLDMTERTTVTGQASRLVESEARRTTDAVAGFDFAAGGEVWVTDNVSIQAGYARSTDNRANPSLIDMNAYETRRDLHTITAGLGLLAGELEANIGAGVQFHRGEMVVFDMLSEEASDGSTLYRKTPLNGMAAMLLLSGKVSAEEAKQQVKDMSQPIRNKMPLGR